MKNHAIIFNWYMLEDGRMMMEFAICTNVEKFAVASVRDGFSVYLGVVEYEGNLYSYAIAFSGIAQLTAIQDTGAIYFPEYARDLLDDGLLEDLELCLFSDDTAQLRRGV